jgi:hypothetical protein
MNMLFPTIIISILLTISAFAQNKTDWNFDGQVQLRSELDESIFKYSHNIKG